MRRENAIEVAHMISMQESRLAEPLSNKPASLPFPVDHLFPSLRLTPPDPQQHSKQRQQSSQYLVDVLAGSGTLLP